MSEDVTLHDSDGEVDKTLEIRDELQAMMGFLGATSSGLEQFVGRAANGMAFVAGKRIGKKSMEGTPRSGDLDEAIEIVHKALKAQGFNWKFEPCVLKGETSATRDEDGDTVIRLTFRDCMIRQTLFRYGHAQQGSLCYLMYGFFAGATEAVMGRKSNLKILHSGPNACLKELHVEAS